jgi:hypothetical protein
MGGPSAPAQSVTACKKCQSKADWTVKYCTFAVTFWSRCATFYCRQPEFNPGRALTRLPSVPTTTYFQTASLLLPRNVGPTRSGAHLHQLVGKSHKYAGPARPTRAWTITFGSAIFFHSLPYSKLVSTVKMRNILFPELAGSRNSHSGGLWFGRVVHARMPPSRVYPMFSRGMPCLFLDSYPMAQWPLHSARQPEIRIRRTRPQLSGSGVHFAIH